MKGKKEVFFMAIAALVMAALFLQPALAVTTQGSIQGTVTDENGKPVSDAEITLLNLGTGYFQTITSHKDGRYRARLLPLGQYQITVVKTGLAVYQQDGVQLTIGDIVTLDIQLKPVTYDQTITVTADAPIVEVNNVDSGSTVNSKAMESLPLNGRNFQDHVLLTAGTIYDNYHVQIGGQRGINNNLMMDGADDNSAFFSEQRGGTRPPFTFSQEAVKEFEVLNNAYSAEFGRAGGGIINAVTKSGTNTFKGSMFYYFRDDSMVESYKHRGDYKKEDPNDFEQHQYGATLGGPILKDKIFFFIAYDGQKKDIPISPYVSDAYSDYDFYDDFRQPYNQTQDANVLLTKIDWIITPNHHATFRHNYSRYISKNGTSTSGVKEYNGYERTYASSFVASLTSIFSETVFNEFRFQYAFEKRPREPNDDSMPGVTIGGSDGLSFGMRSYLPSDVDENRIQFADTLTWVLDNHEIKIGGDWNKVDIDNTFLRYGGGSYYFNDFDDFQAGEPSSYTQAWDRSGNNGKVSFDTYDTSFFIQDSWQPTESLTINAGIRYDYQKQPDVDMPNPNANILPWWSDDDKDRYNPTTKIPSDDNNWGPRIAVAWSPDSDNKTVIRAGWGIFYSRTPSILVANALSNNGYRIATMSMSPSNPNFPDYPNRIPDIPEGNQLIPDIYVFSPDFENPQSRRWSVGVEREVMRDFSISLEYINTTTTHLERKFDINLKEPEYDENRGRYMFSRVKHNPEFNKIIQFTDDAMSKYDAVTLKFNKRFSHHYQFMASYTWSNSRDNDSNLASTEVYGYDFPQNVYDLPDEWGPSDFDVRHRVVASGTYEFSELLQLPDWYQLSMSGIFNYSSGKPWSPRYSGDGNRDGYTANDRPSYFDEEKGEWVHPGRNSERHPSYKNLDLRLTNGFKFNGITAEIILEAFNVFNWANWTVNYSHMYFNESNPPGQDYGKADYPGRPRQYQVGVRFKF